MNVVCELSGGADSALAAIYAKRKYPDAKFYCLFVDYGQLYEKQEAEASLRLAEKIFPGNHHWDRTEVKYLFTDWDARETDTVASEYYPLRNLVITAFAASRAVLVGAEVIVNGSKSLSRVPTDKYSFRDSTLPFYTLMEAAVNGAMEAGRIRIEPLLALGREAKLHKVAVYDELRREGIQPEESWSCYHPLLGVGHYEPCGRCRNCVEKQNALTWLSENQLR